MPVQLSPPAFVDAPSGAIVGPMSFSPVITPTQLSANTDNWNPTGLATASVIRVSSDAARNLTGIVAPPENQRCIILENVGSFTINIVHDSTSTDANRFYVEGATAGGSFPLSSNGSLVLIYDQTSQRWRIPSWQPGDYVTNPENLGTASPGTSPFWSPRDHVHALNGGWTLLGDSTLGGDGTFDFTSLSGSYAHMFIATYLRSDASADVSGLRLRFNNDSAANYDTQYISVVNSTLSGTSSIGTTSINVTSITGNTAASNRFAAGFFFIPHYANTSNFKEAIGCGGAKDTNSASTDWELDYGCGNWRSNSAISRVTLTPSTGTNFKAGSRATVYGIAV